MPQSLMSRVVLLCLAASCSISYAQLPAKPAAKKRVAPIQASSPKERKVIVILRDQMPGALPLRGTRQARASALAASQSSLIAPLQQAHARTVKSFRMINAFATSVTAAEAAKLESNSQVKAVVSDAVIRLPRSRRDLLADAKRGQGAGAQSTVHPNASGSSTPQCDTLEPEALQLTNTAFLDTAHSQAQQARDGHGHPITGRGVKVAYIADGLDPTIPGFIRPDGSSVFIDYQDFTGDPAGTPTGGGEAFGDASSIAAQDMPNGSPLYYDISQFVSTAHPISSPCNIRVRGMAPGASLVGLNVFSSLGFTTTSTFVQAIEWAIFEDDVDVINESFGSNPFFDSGDDPISLANAMAVKAGVTVVASTGDSGTAGTIGSPATNHDTIAAGASTTFRLYAQTSDGVLPFASGYVSNNISSLSSGGFAQSSPRTVDVVAPGDLGWALCSTNTDIYEDCGNYQGNASPIEAFGGTSESSPLISGEAALIIQAYRSTHHDVSPSPALVKRIIMSTATDLGAPSTEQGAGLINSLAAVHMALGINDENGSPKNRGDGLYFDQTSAEFVDKPSSSQTLSFTVRNTGSQPRHLAPHLETLGAPDAGASVAVTLDPATAPTFVDVVGVQRSYIKQTFIVPAGAEHLDAAIAFTPFTSSKLVRLALLSPAGKQVAFSIPQGSGQGYAHVDAVTPSPGKWTAVIYTRSTGGSSYTGTVHFSWSTESFAQLGTVSPAALDLAPGEAKTVTAQFNMPAQPGDTAAAIRFTRLAGEPQIGEAEIPVTLRTLIPVKANGGDFTGTLTGGNGRGATGPSQTFEFNVPSGAKNLDLALNIADSGYLLEGFLVDPNGMQLSIGANLDPLTGDSLNAMQMYHEHPQPGRWHFTLVQNYFSSGNQTSLPFTAHIGLTGVPYTASGLPDDPDYKLSASGAALSVPITVTNNSAVLQTFFADARLRERTISELPLYLCSDTDTLPGICITTYVPPEVNDIQFTAQSNVPISMDAYNYTGYGVAGTDSPDLFSRNIDPDTAVASLRVPEVPWAFWYMFPALVGPFGADGAQPAPVGVGLLVNMRPFDPAVTADSGNAFSDFTFNTNTYNPLVLAPGETGVINITIKADPSQVGQTIKGFVYLDNFSYVIGSGDEVARIPYAYTIVP